MSKNIEKARRTLLEVIKFGNYVNEEKLLQATGIVFGGRKKNL